MARLRFMVNYCFKGPIDEWSYKEIVAWPLMYCSSLGFFGEVFRGIWNGTDVAIKVFLEQDLTAENMEDFCNEISILRYIAIHILFVSNLVFYLNIFWLFPFWIGICFPPAGSDILMVFSNILTILFCNCDFHIVLEHFVF